MSRSVRLLPILIVLLLACVLRFYRLDAQSFWNDEGNSARIAERTVDLILSGAGGDIHPPGYYLLLHGWRALVGQTEFALRSVSALAGVVMVALTYVLGRRLFGRPVGLLATVLATISPLAVYYSQEARMYALLGALSVGSTYAFVRLLPRWSSPPSSRRGDVLVGAIYVLLCAGGLYTQYAFVLIIGVHNVIFSLWWARSTRAWTVGWRWLAAWAGTQVAVAVLYLPWMGVAFRATTGWSPAGQEYVLGWALLDVLRVVCVGLTLPLEAARPALMGFGVLSLVGLFPWRPAGGRRWGGWFGSIVTTVSLVLPIALIFALDLYKAAWLKFFLVVLPSFHVAVGRGVVVVAGSLERIVRLWQRCERGPRGAGWALPVVGGVILLALVGATIPSLRNLYTHPAYARDDYRQIAADVAAVLRPGDAILLNAPNQWEVFTYYYPDQDIYPAPYRPMPADVNRFMTPLAERYRRLFVLFWGDAESDPRRQIETWLAGQAYKADDRWYGRVRLATYGLSARPQETVDGVDVPFGGVIRLKGFALENPWLAPGEILRVALSWEIQEPVAERYKVTVQLFDDGGRLVAQHDGEPGDGLWPTDTWQPGGVVIDRHGVWLPADLSPGRYDGSVGLYHVTTGERLSVDGYGDLFPLGEVNVGTQP